MGIDYDAFLNWAKDRFGEDNIRLHKNEICTHSPFARAKGIDDNNFHLWMNPEGGKKKLEHGAYRCWKTDAKGSLVSLVAMIDNIPFDEAEDLISDSIPLRVLEQKVHEFFGEPVAIDTEGLPEPPTEDLKLPDFSFAIDSLSSGNLHKIAATKYLAKRKLPTTGLFTCISGDYKNRIIIPYYDRDGKLIYYNARTMSDNPKVLRYMKPVENIDINKILYFPDWPHRNARVYLTEGEFDAITLRLAGFYSCACGGKYLSPAQLELLRGYDICLAFDCDSAGKGALLEIGNQLLEMGFSDMTFIRPPKVYKDWNKLLEVRNIQTVKAYINRFETPFTIDTAAIFLAQKIRN